MSSADKYQLAYNAFIKGRFDDALPDLTELAELGYSPALTLLGWAYLLGNGVSKNLEKAKTLLIRGMDEGSAEAAFYLGRAYSMENKHEEAMRCYSFGASKNYAPALFRLAWGYKNGVGLQKNLKRSEHFFLQAAQLGHRISIRELGLMEIKGKFGFFRRFMGLFRVTQFVGLTTHDVIFKRSTDKNIE